MKRIWAVFMAVCLMLSAAACGAPAPDTENPEAGTPPAEAGASQEDSAFSGGAGTEADP